MIQETRALDINLTFLKYTFGRLIGMTSAGVHLIVPVGCFPTAELILLIRSFQGDKLTVGFFTLNWAQRNQTGHHETTDIAARLTVKLDESAHNWRMFNKLPGKNWFGLLTKCLDSKSITVVRLTVGFNCATQVYLKNSDYTQHVCREEQKKTEGSPKSQSLRISSELMRRFSGLISGRKTQKNN